MTDAPKYDVRDDLTSLIDACEGIFEARVARRTTREALDARLEAIRPLVESIFAERIERFALDDFSQCVRCMRAAWGHLNGYWKTQQYSATLLELRTIYYLARWLIDEAHREAGEE